MILFPTNDLKDVRHRADKILQHGIECRDVQLLDELLCALRNAEFAHPYGSKRERLHEMREDVSEAIEVIQAGIDLDAPLSLR